MKVATYLTDLLDNRFRILGIRFGIDPLLDIFPFLGGVLPTLLSFYLVWLAYQVKVPQNKIHEMIGNVILDFVIGLIPFIGVVGDVFYKANSKNLKILKQYYVPIKEAEIVSPSLTPAVGR